MNIMSFNVNEAYRTADILASHAAGIPSYWQDKRLGWYFKKDGGKFNGPYPTEAVARAAFYSWNQTYPNV